MDELLVARAQMTLLFAFHIVFAVAGMGMPLLMVLAEGSWLRTGKPVYRELARRWSRGMAVLFAIGAVSGTVLSFELGLLWPRFMAFAGGIIGYPFALEGFAFFAEAIFLGIYLYGWERVPPRAHLLSGILVALGGLFSGLLIVTANAWMNSPAGFAIEGGRLARVDPVAAMLNPAAWTEPLHMALAAYIGTGFAVAGIHAWLLLRDRGNDFHRKAMGLALAVGGVAAILQLASGDANARFIARDQPVKLAAMEGQFRTERGAPLRIGGLPDPERETTRFALEIPRGLSLLAFHDPDATVRGLSAFPRDEWPDPVPVHLAFQVMVAFGTAMPLLALAAAYLHRRRRERLFRPPFLYLVILCAPMGILSVEAGWIVTEMGRQPWIIRGIMRTADAVTTVRGLAVPFAIFSLLYFALGLTAAGLLRRETGRSPFFPAEVDVPPPHPKEGG